MAACKASRCQQVARSHTLTSRPHQGSPFTSLVRTGPEGTTTYQRANYQYNYASPYSNTTWTTKIFRQSVSGGSSDETDVNCATDSYYRGMETSRKVYAGGAGGTPLLSIMRCYNGATGDCTLTIPHLPITGIDESRS